jgi:hypothetical protein
MTCTFFQLYERLLQEFIYTWYSLLSYDEDFVQELRQIFRHASLELWSRVSKVSSSNVMLKKHWEFGSMRTKILLVTAVHRCIWFEYLERPGGGSMSSFANFWKVWYIGAMNILEGGSALIPASPHPCVHLCHQY